MCQGAWARARCQAQNPCAPPAGPESPFCCQGLRTCRAQRCLARGPGQAGAAWTSGPEYKCNQKTPLANRQGAGVRQQGGGNRAKRALAQSHNLERATGLPRRKPALARTLGEKNAKESWAWAHNMDRASIPQGIYGQCRLRQRSCVLRGTASVRIVRGCGRAGQRFLSACIGWSPQRPKWPYFTGYLREYSRRME